MRNRIFVIESDGPQYLEGANAYRGDRRKDALLQGKRLFCAAFFWRKMRQKPQQLYIPLSPDANTAIGGAVKMYPTATRNTQEGHCALSKPTSLWPRLARPSRLGPPGLHRFRSGLPQGKGNIPLGLHLAHCCRSRFNWSFTPLCRPSAFL